MTGRWVAGTVLILAGLWFLGMNFGLLPWGLWLVLWRWWPAGLIVIGLGLLAGGRLRGPVIALGLVGLFGAALAWSLVAGPGYTIHWDEWPPRLVPGAAVQPRYEQFSLARPPDAGRVTVRLRFGAGELNLGPGASGLAEGRLSYYLREPVVDLSRLGGAATLTIENQDRWDAWVARPQGLRYEWEIRLGAGIPLDLELDAGAARGRLDLRGLQVQRVMVNGGAASLDILVGSESDIVVDVNAGASSITVSAPREAGVRVLVQAAGSSHNLDQLGFARAGREWVSPNFEAAERRVEIRLTAAATRFTLDLR